MSGRDSGSSVERGRPFEELVMPLAASLTLGLAPFVPEPHAVGKIRWVAGGAEGMAAMDFFDLAMHGVPWLWLMWTVARLARPTKGMSS